MKRKIKIEIGNITSEAELNQTEIANKIWDILPISANVNLWGDEIYFSIPKDVNIKIENPKEIVELGDLGYWKPGNAFCIFFGKTPASSGNEIRPASAVEIFGKVITDVKVFKKVKSGSKITIDKG